MRPSVLFLFLALACDGDRPAGLEGSQDAPGGLEPSQDSPGAPEPSQDGPGALEGSQDGPGALEGSQDGPGALEGSQDAGQDLGEGILGRCDAGSGQPCAVDGRIGACYRGLCCGGCWYSVGAVQECRAGGSVEACGANGDACQRCQWGPCCVTATRTICNTAPGCG